MDKVCCIYFLVSMNWLLDKLNDNWAFWSLCKTLGVTFMHYAILMPLRLMNTCTVSMNKQSFNGEAAWF